jgi:hypothetical protein
MKPINKWVSVLGVSLAMLVLLYFTGVVNSGVSLGVALAVMAGVILLSVLLIPGPKEKK